MSTFTSYRVIDANGHSFGTKDRRAAFRHLMSVAAPAKMVKGTYVLSPRGEYVKLSEELLLTRK